MMTGMHNHEKTGTHDEPVTEINMEEENRSIALPPTKAMLSAKPLFAVLTTVYSLGNDVTITLLSTDVVVEVLDGFGIRAGLNDDQCHPS